MQTLTYRLTCTGYAKSTLPWVLLVVIFAVTGCSYRLGTGNSGAQLVPVRVEVENHTSVAGLSARFMQVLLDEARAFPGVRISAAVDEVVQVTLIEAGRDPLSVDDLGRATESRMRLKAHVHAGMFPQVIEMDSLGLTSALHRARRTPSPQRAEEQALASIARALLTAIVEKGRTDASF